MKFIFALLAALMLLTGCASLNYAGNASYSVKPFITEPGVAVCCEVIITDGKERASLDLHVVKTGDNYDITLSEKQVAAFTGQQIAATAGVSNVVTAAKVAAGVAVAPAIIGAGALGAVAVGAGGAALLTPSAPSQPASEPVK